MIYTKVYYTRLTFNNVNFRKTIKVTFAVFTFNLNIEDLSKK
jgi:hypothetical protein